MARPKADPDGKRALRKRCWLALRVAGAVRFPGVEGRIPNFVGAEEAARRLFESPRWKRARVIKCNPDSPQRPVRHRALVEGKRLYMAVPRLADEHNCFIELDAAWLDETELWQASSISGCMTVGRGVTLAEMAPIDLIVTGCVGATREGARLGKGGGYSDLEYALLREAGLITARTPVATTLHPAQLVRKGGIPMLPHDQSLDLIATPAGLIDCPRTFERPRGILWESLDEERIAAIPALREAHRRRGRRR